MADFRFKLNPRGRDLPHCSAVLNGRGRQYQVNDYRTTLSLKSVVRGRARYDTPQGHYLLTPDSFLILNDGQRYSLQFDGQSETETLCPFFQLGFLEHAVAGAGASAERQLEEPELTVPALDFCERLYPKAGAVGRALSDLHTSVRFPQASAAWLEDHMYTLAHALAGLRLESRGEAEKFPGLRAGTRAELYRRLYRGRDFLLSCYDRPLTVAAAAQVAALSPFHFQRMFKLAFGRTPMQFLQEARLEAARGMLVRTGDDITNVCLAAGFESLGSFSWLFRKRFGVSPRAFRSQSQNRRIEEVFSDPAA